MIYYVTPEEVLVAHSELIERYGGLHGLRDLGLLESALARPRAGFGTFEAYPALADKIAILLQGLILNHPFLDGNKRTAFAMAAVFSERNGYLFIFEDHALVEFVLKIANHELEFEEIRADVLNHLRKKR